MGCRKGKDGSPQKVQRAKFPISSLEWLAEKLSKQGAFMGDIQKLSMGAQAELAQMTPPQQQAYLQQQATQGQGQQQQGNPAAAGQPYLSSPNGGQKF